MVEVYDEDESADTEVDDRGRIYGVTSKISFVSATLLAATAGMAFGKEAAVPLHDIDLTDVLQVALPAVSSLGSLVTGFVFDRLSRQNFDTDEMISPE